MLTKKHITRSLMVVLLALAVLVSGLGVRPAAAAKDPEVEVYEAVEDESLTFAAFYLPANSDFDVILSRHNSRVTTTWEVGSFTANSKGEVQGTVELAGSNWSAETWYTNYTFKKSAPTAPVTEAEEERISTTRVVFEERQDAYQGGAGLYMPSSNYTGWLELERIMPADTNVNSKLRFQQDLIRVGVYDSKMRLFDNVWGFNYLYFNLTSATRRLYDQGKLDIYYYDTGKKAWQPCGVQVFVNKGYHGRLSCVISNWGLYALATPVK